jgi:methylenetetrahydrofolate dehydrogenase (NADP+)/methenyltetrahydrofolate cyclohydrolase
VAEARIIDGKARANALQEGVGRAVAALVADHQVTPGLAVVLVGDDPASHIYVRNKNRRTRELGMESISHNLQADTPEGELLALVGNLNADRGVNGILVQLPLPPQIDANAVIDAIDPAKDVDGLNAVNAGRLAAGRFEDALIPCTPQGCLVLIKDAVSELAGLNAVVVGRSNLVGKPVAQLLLAEHCTVTLTHSRTRDLAGEIARADILVAAAGRARMIPGEWIDSGATVIDVGINRIEGEDGKSRLVGDVDFETARHVAGAITPVPGGVGPMTIACLLRNTVIAACRQHGIAPAGALAV